MARRRRKRGDEDTRTGELSPSTEARARLTPVEIQQKVFRLAFRGYNERDVDEFLDRVTEDLAVLHEENKRLREQLAEGGSGGGDVEDARRQSEQIVREAREHAARLIEDAEARASSGSGGAAGAAEGGALSTSFLLRERQFLQQLASLVQEHARGLKEEARRSRQSSRPEPQGEAPATPPERAAQPSPPTPEPGGRPAEPPAGAMGAAAAAAAAGAPTTPEPPTAEEPTAPWTPVDEEGRGEPRSEASPPDRDELVSAWESAFGGGSPEGAAGSGPSGAFPRRDEGNREGEEEPSLRELFWGEE